MSSEPTVAIIGAGVIGLSTGIKLQARFPQHHIVLLAQEWPAAAPLGPSTNYASMWAGAHVRPIPASTPQLQREAAWLKQTVTEFDRLIASHPTCGITRAKGIEYLDTPDQAYLEQDAASFARETGLAKYRKLEPSELPDDNVELGFEYETFCVNPPVYCAFLLRRFLLQGGRALQATLKSEAEAWAFVPDAVLVVNASGTGFGDSDYFPTRGHTVLTNLDIDTTITRQAKDGSWTFLIPRFFDGGTIVGGTKEPHDWRSAPSPSSRKTLLANGLNLLKTSSSLEQIKHEPIHVLTDIVGRRPTRLGGVRLEVEEIEQQLSRQSGAAQDGFFVIHAYGAGGRGFEISWGVASDVVALALPLLAKKTLKK